MLKTGEINPLNVFSLRNISHCPPHFTKVYVDSSAGTHKQISDWIYENLKGRYYINDAYVKNERNHTNLQICVAFEIASEASFFGLMLDKIN